LSNGETTIDLAEDGLPGEWLTVANLGLKSPKQFKHLRQLPQTDAELAALPEGEAAQAARDYLALVVIKWCVNDPETGQPLPPPNSPDLDPDAIPGIVSARIKSEVQRQVAALNDLKAG
jgi:hypothetical protein